METKPVAKEDKPVQKVEPKIPQKEAPKEVKPVQKVETKAELNEEAKQQLLQLSEISLWIDTYDDIFSDFDPRPYSQRALSQDFLFEAQRASRDLASGKGQIKFLVPEAQRNSYQESVIKKRLKDHFKKHLDDSHKEIKKLIKQGLAFASIGVVIMFIATFILFKFPENNILTTFLIVFSEPAGWYFFWEGLNTIRSEPKRIKPILEFYEKM